MRGRLLTNIDVLFAGCSLVEFGGPKRKLRSCMPPVAAALHDRRRGPLVVVGTPCKRLIIQQVVYSLVVYEYVFGNIIRYYDIIVSWSDSNK